MRYLPLTDQDRTAMLAEIGVGSVDDLFKDVPASAYKPGQADLPAHQGEMAVERQLTRMAAKNQTAGSGPFFLGAGNYRHHVPATVDALIQRGEFLTAYTPYQPEVSQGTLQYLFEFQTQVAQMTGMDVANASMYDGATACAEAAMMAARVTRRKKVLLSGTVHPHYAQTTETYLRYTDIEAEILPPDPIGMEDILGRVASDLACVIVQSPSFFGNLKDYEEVAKMCREDGVLLVVVVAEPVSLGLIRSPGEMGADIVVGEGQALGNAMAFGGPGLGLFATTQKYVRQMPGRLVGETLDVDGRRGWVLTLATREQHIRREKATSNICTNSGLCALAFSIHMGLLGEAGFTKLAEINHAKAVLLADKIEGLKGQGVDLLSKTFFNEFSINLPRPAAEVVEDLAAQGILAGVPASRFWPRHEELETVLLVAATELSDEADMDALIDGLKEAL